MNLDPHIDSRFTTRGQHIAMLANTGTREKSVSAKIRGPHVIFRDVETRAEKRHWYGPAWQDRRGSRCSIVAHRIQLREQGLGGQKELGWGLAGAGVVARDMVQADARPFRQYAVS
jgi:hypothetical protein